MSVHTGLASIVAAAKTKSTFRRIQRCKFAIETLCCYGRKMAAVYRACDRPLKKQCGPPLPPEKQRFSIGRLWGRRGRLQWYCTRA
eukprot:2275605-Rhodomonas_salina.3